MNLEKSAIEEEKYDISSFLNENEIQERYKLLDEIKTGSLKNFVDLFVINLIFHVL